MAGIFIQFDSGNGYSAVFEDNGRVAYAYLLKNHDIIGDVWLYNRCPTPAKPEWGQRELMPFANSVAYVSAEVFLPVVDEREIQIKWIGLNANDLVSVEVLIRGIVMGLLKPGSKPGWATLAVRKGPIAIPMEFADES